MSSDPQLPAVAPNEEKEPERAPVESGSIAKLQAWMFSPENSAGLAVYRIFWGGLMAWEAYRYLRSGWVHKYYVAPNYLFSYIGFDWLAPLPGWGMTGVYVLMIVAGIAVSIGLLYRVFSTVFFVCHTYVFLLAASNYLNHAYLIALLAFIMIFLPANRTLSVDAALRRGRASSSISRWPRALLLTQLGIVYFYGGIAKINTDWLVYHQPIRKWMQGSSKKVPGFASEFVASELFTQMVAYGGVMFDLLIAPALLWRRTRPFAVLVAAGFHVSNMQLFSIGVFPWLMLAATTLFLEPDWPRRLPFAGPHVARGLDWFSARSQPWTASALRIRWTSLALGVWLAIQVLVPLRHVLYPGDVAWNEDGHYCAWRMKLRSKKGVVKFRVVDKADGRTWVVDPASDLSKRQARKIRGKPELIRQYANLLVQRYRDEEGIEVDVYVDAFASLNYRKRQRFIDPQYELGHEPPSLAPYRWVLPFEWTEPPHPGQSAS